MTYDGLVYDLEEATYHAQPGLSSTGAKKILKSPAHFRHYQDNPHETKAEFDVGSAVHAKVLGVGADIAIYPDGNGSETFEYEGETLQSVLAANGAISTKAARAFGDDARSRGLIPVKRVVGAVINRMAESVLSNQTARALLEGGHPEVSMFATDPDTGVDGRGRLDYLGKRITDLKTTSGEASETGFAIHAFKFGYHVQEGHYEHLYELITGEDAPPYLFVVVETDAPYVTAVHVLGDDERRMGRDLARRARETYARCRDSGVWPGYSTRTGNPIGILRAPVWSINEYIDQLEGAVA